MPKLSVTDHAAHQVGEVLVLVLVVVVGVESEVIWQAHPADLVQDWSLVSRVGGFSVGCGTWLCFAA